jgi:hypothetical protein
LANYDTRLCEQYGKVMKEYVEVPDSLLRDADDCRTLRTIRIRCHPEAETDDLAHKDIAA